MAGGSTGTVRRTGTARRGRLRRATAWAGPAGIAVGFLAVLASVALAPWFSWTANALSDLGHPSRATAPLFNGGLVLAGLLGVAFAGRVWLGTTNALQRVGVGIFAFSQLSLGLIGVFPESHPLHFTVSVLYFASFTYALFALGSGDAIAGATRRGVLTTWLGVAHATVWFGWPATGFEGVAIPEFLGSALLAVWVLLAFRDLR